ncbi:MAG: GGDEF domain-containing protein [Magnetococcales bacterium]|nr:GGDEF domain-containing protein [Magnetococcales bacterium]
MLLTEMTLTEQLKLSDRKISDRKKLFDISHEDERNLLAVKPYIDKHLHEIVEEYYSILLRHSDVELVIGDADTLLRLKSAMRGYIQEIFSGQYDMLYVNNRLRVGMVHKRIGVSPTLFMAGVRVLWNILQDALESQCNDGSCSRYDAEQRKRSLNKLMMFDVQFTFETYTGALVSEVQKAKQELEVYARDLEAEVMRRTQELKDLARLDGLTGVLNQRAFFDHLRNDLAHAKRRREKVSIAYFDLNRFKQLNDRAGHRAGDLVLAHVGECLLATVRETDSACRYGGDEFVMILPGNDLEQTQAACQRLCDRFIAKAGESGVGFSIGLAETGPDTFLSPDDFVKVADQRMYKSKASSRVTAGFWCTGNGDSVCLLESPASEQPHQGAPG